MNRNMKAFLAGSITFAFITLIIGGLWQIGENQEDLYKFYKKHCKELGATVKERQPNLFYTPSCLKTIDNITKQYYLTEITGELSLIEVSRR